MKTHLLPLTASAVAIFLGASASAQSQSSGSPSPAGASAETQSTASSQPSTSYSVTPTLSGGLTASAHSSDENGFAYLDGYYMPFGDHMTGGGLSIMGEQVNPESDNGFGFRFGGYYMSGSSEGYDMSMGGILLDFYLVHRVADCLSLYAGAGMFTFYMEMGGVPYVHIDRSFRRVEETQDAEGDATFFSCFGGARLRIADTFSLFCEYRWQDGDVTMTLSKSHVDMKAEDVGGGSVVFGGGFMF